MTGTATMTTTSTTSTTATTTSTTTATSTTTTATTAELLDAARRGESAAYEEIVRRHERRLWCVVRQYRLNHADAQDVVQVTWLRLLENLDRIHDPERLSSWLATTATRECLGLVRRTKREVGDVETCLVRRADETATSPEQHAVGRAMAAVLRKQVATLPVRGQALLWALSRYDSPGYLEVAQLMGMPVGSVGPTRGRYLRRLRSQLEEAGLTSAALY